MAKMITFEDETKQIDIDVEDFLRKEKAKHPGVGIEITVSVTKSPQKPQTFKSVHNTNDLQESKTRSTRASKEKADDEEKDS